MTGTKRLSLFLFTTLAALMLAAACSAPAAAPAPTTAPAAPAKPAATTAPAAPAAPAPTTAAAAPAAPAPTTAAAAAAQPTGPTIKIGFGAPTTGDQAYAGQSYANGAIMRVDEINAAGGVLGSKLQLDLLDDQADPKQGTVVAQRFADDPAVMIVIAHYNSGVTIPTMPIYNKARLAQLTVSSNPSIVQQGFDTVFRIGPNDNTQGGVAANYAYKTLNLKKAVVIHDKQAFGQGVAEQFAKLFQSLGGTVTSINGITHGDTDFSAVVTKIKGEAPDSIYFGGTQVDGGLLLKQIRAQGMKQPFFSDDGLYDPGFISTAGADIAEGSYITFNLPPYDSSPALEQFAANYKKKFGQDPGSWSARGYDAVNIAVAGIKAAGKADRDAIVKALHSTTLDTMYGPVAWESNGELKNAPSFMFQVKSGKFVLLK